MKQLPSRIHQQFLSNFPLEKFVPIFWWFFSRMASTQAIKHKKDHSIPSWYEESKNSKTGLKNWNKLCHDSIPKRTSYEEVMPVLLNSAQNIFQSESNYEIESRKIWILFFFSFFFSRFFSLFFSPSFQNKLDKMQIGSSKDVNDLNYDCDNE